METPRLPALATSYSESHSKRSNDRQPRREFVSINENPGNRHGVLRATKWKAGNIHADRNRNRHNVNPPRNAFLWLANRGRVCEPQTDDGSNSRTQFGRKPATRLHVMRPSLSSLLREADSCRTPVRMFRIIRSPRRHPAQRKSYGGWGSLRTIARGTLASGSTPARRPDFAD
jgi:hypothetical protein